MLKASHEELKKDDLIWTEQITDLTAEAGGVKQCWHELCMKSSSGPGLMTQNAGGSRERGSGCQFSFPGGCQPHREHPPSRNSESPTISSSLYILHVAVHGGWRQNGVPWDKPREREGKRRQTSCGQSKAMLETGELLSLRNTPSNIHNASSQEVLVVGCGHARCFQLGEGRFPNWQNGICGSIMMGLPQNNWMSLTQNGNLQWEGQSVSFSKSSSSSSRIVLVCSCCED